MKSLKRLRLGLALVSLLIAAPLSVTAGTSLGEKNPVAPAPPDPRVHALLQLDFSNAYITPRGLVVQNDQMVFQPLFLVFWDLYRATNKDALLQDITLTAGVWSDVGTTKGGTDPGYWNEFDPIAGLAFKLKGGFKLETNFTAFDSMVDDYPTSTHFQAILSFDDSKILGAWAMHPYVAFWQELHNKATVVFDPAKSHESNYFTFGVNPSIQIKAVKLEFPTYINVVGKNFYQQFDGSPGGSDLAVFGTEAKASVPLKFIPKDLGSWTFYAGVKYYHLSNPGLLDGNVVLTPNDHKKDQVQYHAGISIFF